MARRGRGCTKGAAAGTTGGGSRACTGPSRPQVPAGAAPRLWVDKSPVPGLLRVQWSLGSRIKVATVQESSNLRDWFPIRTVTEDGYMDHLPVHARRFWRLAYSTET